MSFGLIIKNAREKLGLTQLELAKELDCSDAYITKIEKGERVPAEVLIESMAGTLHLDRNEMMRLALKESNPKIYSAFRIADTGAPLKSAKSTEGTGLSLQDRIVLKLFRALPPEDKMEIIGLLRAHIANLENIEAKEALDELKEEVKLQMIGGG
jgi:transcriptional regulator with XRE-family HTH domain